MKSEDLIAKMDVDTAEHSPQKEWVGETQCSCTQPAALQATLSAPPIAAQLVTAGGVPM